RFVGVYRKGGVVPPAGVPDVIGAAANGPPRRAVDDVDDQRCVDRDGRMETAWRLPRAVADSAHELALGAGRLERQLHAIARDRKALGHQPANPDLEPFDRGVHVPGGTAGARLLAEHVPRFDRLPELDFDALIDDASIDRKPEFEMWREPVGFN